MTVNQTEYMPNGELQRMLIEDLVGTLAPQGPDSRGRLFGELAEKLKSGESLTFGPRYEAIVSTHTEQLDIVIRKTLDDPPNFRVVCAFGSILDHTCTLAPEDTNALEEFNLWVDTHSEAFGSAPHSQNKKLEVKHPEDVRDLVEIAFKNSDNKSAGGKSKVANMHLRQALLRGDPPFPAKRTTLGGAPSVISNTLSQLGVPSCFYAPYHANEVASRFHDSAWWLDLNRHNPLEWVPAAAPQQGDHPVRHGVAIAYAKGEYPRYFLGGTEARQSNRQLLQLKPPVLPAGARPWSSWTLNGVEQKVDDDLAENEWVSVSAFATWKLSSNQLHITLVDDDNLLRDLGTQNKYFILSSPQFGEVLSDNSADKVVIAALRRQLELIHSYGACTHLELSGEAGSRDIKKYADFIAGTIDSVGVNADELPSYARLARPGIWKEPEGQDDAPPVRERFAQALALAEALQVERLYVHGNDVDIILRRDTADDVMLVDTSGDLFAKAVVLVATVLRNPSEVIAGLKWPKGMGIRTSNALRDTFDARIGGLEEARAETSKMRGIVCPDREENGYRGAIVPCVWLDPDEIPNGFSTTGAGDITSGVSIVYSGFHMSRNSVSKGKDAA